MVLLSILVFPAMLLRHDMDPRLLLIIDLPLFLGATVSVILFYVVSQIAVNQNWRLRICALSLHCWVSESDCR